MANATDNSADWGESPSLMEPLMIREGVGRYAHLAEQVLQLCQKTAALRHTLPEPLLESLAALGRLIDCYYSNLIEGHELHPVETERALKGDYSSDAQTRDLQREAQAHVAVQRWIDEGGLNGQALTAVGLREIHARFTSKLPEALSHAVNPDTGEALQLVPGELRTTMVRVGQHVPVSPGAVPRFLERFETAYSKLGKLELLLALAAAHHRLVWIHPFVDGNGRVARLMSYAVLRELLDTGGIWSIARGLAQSADDYKAHLTACDQPRRNDLDGRGRLSEEALVAFSGYFLETCLEQVEFMHGLLRPDALQERICRWAEKEMRGESGLPKHSDRLMQAVLVRGELARGDVVSVTDTSEQKALQVTSALIARGVLSSESLGEPLRLVFPAEVASHWLPGLFPARP